MSAAVGAVRAALDLAKRDPEAQRIATEARVERREAHKVLALALNYAGAIARAERFRQEVVLLREIACSEHGGVVRGARVIARKVDAAVRAEGHARAYLLGLLQLGVSERDLERVGILDDEGGDT